MEDFTLRGKKITCLINLKPMKSEEEIYRQMSVKVVQDYGAQFRLKIGNQRSLLKFLIK